MKDEFEGLGLDSLRECFELIGTPPNEDLLRKYVTEESGQRPNPPLTVREREWIEANLRCNLAWQRVYRALSGKKTARRVPHRLLPVAVAVAVLVVAPLWIDSLYVARAPSEEALQEILERDREVLRGSFSEPLQLPQSEESVVPPTLRFLVSVDPFDPDTTNLLLLKQLLIEEYHSSQDELNRARAAMRLNSLSLILKDIDGAEFWRERCEDEGVSECR